MVYYFAYGSNMKAERMKKRGLNFKSSVHGVLNGYSLKFNKIASDFSNEGYANIVLDKKGVVEGILYEVTENDLNKLDIPEGVSTGHYYRKEVDVQLDSGEKVKAIAYVAQQNKIKEGLKPSKDYLNHLLEGKKFLSKEYFKKLSETETL